MTLKNQLKIDNVSEPQYQIYHDHVKIYKRFVSRTKRLHVNKFHTEICNFKTRNPKEFWKLIQTKPSCTSTNSPSIMFKEFVDHFRELSIDSTLTDPGNSLYDLSVAPINDVINQPFTVDEIKSSIKQLKLCKASGADNMIN